VGVFDGWMICGLMIDEAAAYFCLAPGNRQFKVLFAFRVGDSAPVVHGPRFFSSWNHTAAEGDSLIHNGNQKVSICNE
jgi:hypothetical protein